jgi:plasmid replication initiation protein
MFKVLFMNTEITPLNFDNLDTKNLDVATIRKHNDLIEAKYQIHSIQEQRIILLLLAQIKPNDADFKGYKIAVSDFAKIIGLQVGGVYTELEQALKNLMTRVISIRSGKSFLLMGWLSSAKYVHGSGYVELAFDPNLKPYLLQLKDHYTQYKFNSVLHFKSIYSIRLYELLKKESFKARNGYFDVFIEYDQLRESFGVGKKEYASIKDFRVKAIEPATKEISDKTDLYINDVRYGKTGRKITNITFCVTIRTEDETKQRQANLRRSEITPEKNKDNIIHPIIESLMSHGFSFELARKYKNKHGVKKIERNIAYTLAKKQAGLIKDIPAYLNMAIENDYGGAWDVEHQQADVKKQAQVQKEQQQKAKEAQLSQAKKARYQQAFTAYQGLPEDQQAALKKAFLDTTNPLVAKQSNAEEKKGKQAFSSPLVLSTFKVFLVEEQGF